MSVGTGRGAVVSLASAVVALALTGPVHAQRGEPEVDDVVHGLTKSGGAKSPDGEDLKDVREEDVVRTPGRGTPIPNQYIIVFRPGTARPREVAERLARDHGGSVQRVYEHVFPGFAGRFPEEAVDGLRRNPNIELLEQDQVVGVGAVQSSAPWGLDRIDERALPMDGSYIYNTDGSGTQAYVIDTGIRLDHQEFAGRMGRGFDAVTSGGNANDCNGHGTHVAGTVGGTTYGVAKRLTMYPVRVLNCSGSGSNASVIAGVDWVRYNHVRPAVANISLGGGASSAVDMAVESLVQAGVTTVVAAGNDNQNACNVSPARAAAAITVGSITPSDARSSFSNYGTCLDVFAPGSSITSAWHTSPTATNTISGTSMASPHVAGVAALVLADYPQPTSQQVRDKIVANGTANVVTNAGSGSPNVLVYSLLGTATTPPPTPPPGTNVLINPGFESGTTGWTQHSSGGFPLIDPMKARSGSYGVWLGGYNDARDQVVQKVTVPSSGRLSYWWWVTSGEGTSTPYDYMYVELLDANGANSKELRRRTNTAVRDAWYEDVLSLSDYAGKEVYLRFRATTDPSVPTDFYIDDTRLATP